MRFPLFLVMIALLFGACEKERSTKTKPQTPPSQTVKKEAPKPPSFTFVDGNRTVHLTIEGDTITSDIPKPIVLYFFYTSWCPSCKAQMPELQRLYQSFKKDLFILGLPLDRGDKRADFFCSQSIEENEKFAKSIYPRLQAGANMPIPLILVTKNGRYFIHYKGAVPYEILKSDIQRAKGE